MNISSEFFNKVSGAFNVTLRWFVVRLAVKNKSVRNHVVIVLAKEELEHSLDTK